MKFKPLKMKPLKGVDTNIIKIDKKTDTDRDGVPDFFDCQPLNSKMQGLHFRIGELFKGHKAKKELEQAEKLDVELSDEHKRELEGEIKVGEKQKEAIISNIKAGFKGTDKNFQKVASGYVKREGGFDPLARIYSRRTLRSSIRPRKTREEQSWDSTTRLGRKAMGYEPVVKRYLLPETEKLFKTSSIPDMSVHEDKFTPPVTGNIFRPPTFVPPDLQRKRERQRELQCQRAREYLIEHSEVINR